MPPMRPQRNVPKPRRFQSSSSEAEKTEVKKKRRRGQIIKTDAQKFKKQADSVKENILVMKKVLQLQTANQTQTYKPIPLCPSNSSSVLPSNTSWKKAITTIAQTPAEASVRNSRSLTIQAVSASISSNNISYTTMANHDNRFLFSPMQCSTTISVPISNSIANAKSVPNLENYPSVSSLQYSTTTTTTFVTSTPGNFVTSETYRYNCLTSDTTEHTAPFTSSTYVPPSWEPISHQPVQVAHVTACNSASSFCDPMVYAVQTRLTSNADHVEDQLSVSMTHKQRLIENTQNFAESTQSEFFRPIETSTPEPHEHLSNNQINEEDKQGEDNRNEQGEDENELGEDEEDENTNNSVISNAERLNANQSVNLSVNDRNQAQDAGDRQIE